jgi:hypothetical protein
MIYGIWCEVSGGRTGLRCGWLKSDGVIRMWTDRDAATIEALRLTRERNSATKQASFRYTVKVRS